MYYVTALFDIPRYESRIESLHVLFSLFSAVKNYKDDNRNETPDQDEPWLVKNYIFLPIKVSRKCLSIIEFSFLCHRFDILVQKYIYYSYSFFFFCLNGLIQGHQHNNIFNATEPILTNSVSNWKYFHWRNLVFYEKGYMIKSTIGIFYWNHPQFQHR